MPSREPTRALLIEDQADRRRLLRALLADARQGRVELAFVDTVEAAIERLDAGERFDVVLVDRAPGDGGAGDPALELAARHVDVAVLVLSPLEDELARRAVAQALGESEGMCRSLIEGVRDHAIVNSAARGPASAGPQLEVGMDAVLLLVQVEGGEVPPQDLPRPAGSRGSRSSSTTSPSGPASR